MRFILTKLEWASAAIMLLSCACNKVPAPEQQHSDNTGIVHDTNKEVATEFFKVRATVTKIDRQSGKIILVHQKIPGFMDSMTMTSAFADTSTIDHIHIGSIGTFTLRVRNRIPEVTNVESCSGKSNNSKKQEVRTYRVLAKVTAINRAEGTMTINHEKMDGFMESMEMPYKVGDPALFAKVAVGTEGHFTIRVVEEEGTITAIHVHSK